jgi:hypothetical protein
LPDCGAAGATPVAARATMKNTARNRGRMGGV